MAGIHLSIDKAELERLRAFMDAQAALDPGGLMPPLGEYLMRSTQSRFKTQTAPDGTPWAALKPRYARRKKYNKDKVLTLRGYLRSFVHYQITGPAEVQVGSSRKYAAVHQFGASIDKSARPATVRYRSQAARVLLAGRKHQRATERQVSIPAHQVHMPERPFLGISQEDDREIRQIILDWMLERGK